jgi:hypothetical protein
MSTSKADEDFKAFCIKHNLVTDTDMRGFMNMQEYMGHVRREDEEKEIESKENV